jgi:hypothetical protein
MHRVVANDGIEFFGNRRYLDIVDTESAADFRFVVDELRDDTQTFFRDLDQRGADVDARHVVAEPRKVFAQPARAAGDVKKACARGQSQRHRHVRKVAEMPVRLRVHSFPAELRWFVRQVIKGFRPQIVQTLRVKFSGVIDRGLLVIDSFELR